MISGPGHSRQHGPHPPCRQPASRQHRPQRGRSGCSPQAGRRINIQLGWLPAEPGNRECRAASGEELFMTARSRRRPRRRTAAGCWPSTSPPALPPGAVCSACTTATTSRTPSRARCATGCRACRPARPPRPRPRAEDQPDLALGGGVPSLLAGAVRPARTRLTSHPVPAPGKGGRPAQSEPVPLRAHPAAPPPGKTRTRRRCRKPARHDQ
jgi:hypothetical protein